MPAWLSALCARPQSTAPAKQSGNPQDRAMAHPLAATLQQQPLSALLQKLRAAQVQAPSAVPTAAPLAQPCLAVLHEPECGAGPVAELSPQECCRFSFVSFPFLLTMSLLKCLRLVQRCRSAADLAAQLIKLQDRACHPAAPKPDGAVPERRTHAVSSCARQERARESASCLPSAPAEQIDAVLQKEATAEAGIFGDMTAILDASLSAEEASRHDA